jgi:anti-sigma regulatory factor (Ser/Thr protein kinase)
MVSAVTQVSSVTTRNEERVNPGFRHPALFYSGAGDYLAGTVPFVRAGLEAGEPVAVAVPPENLAVLAGGLGADVGAVHFLDMTRVGRNPGRIIPGVLRAFADAHPGNRVRIIGEPIWSGRTSLEYPACVQHEALINCAFAGRDVEILCPYDLDSLDETALRDARATHPVLIAGDKEWASDEFDPDGVVARYNRPLPPMPADAASLAFDVDCLAALRRFVVAEAVRHNLPEQRRDDLELMVDELATNAVRHGTGTGTAHLWASSDDRVWCEVTAGGVLGDPMAGREPVRTDADRGRGLLLVNHLADLVRVHTSSEATTVRLCLAVRLDEDCG